MSRDRQDTNKNYDEMSREELVTLIGIEDDPTMSRTDLIVMAMERDDKH